MGRLVDIYIFYFSQVKYVDDDVSKNRNVNYSCLTLSRRLTTESYGDKMSLQLNNWVIRRHVTPAQPLLISIFHLTHKKTDIYIANKSCYFLYPWNLVAMGTNDFAPTADKFKGKRKLQVLYPKYLVYINREKIFPII